MLLAPGFGRGHRPVPTFGWVTKGDPPLARTLQTRSRRHRNRVSVGSNPVPDGILWGNFEAAHRKGFGLPCRSQPSPTIATLTG